MTPSKLRLARLARGLKLSDVAARLGVSHQALSLWERGLRTPEASTVKALASIYRISQRKLAVAPRNGR